MSRAAGEGFDFNDACLQVLLLVGSPPAEQDPAAVGWIAHYYHACDQVFWGLGGKPPPHWMWRRAIERIKREEA